MPDEKTIRNLVRLIYESSVNAQLWDQFLVNYAKAIKSGAVALSVMDRRNRRGNVFASCGIEPIWEKRYAEYYGKLNVWVHGTNLFRKPGTIAKGEEVIRDADLEKTEFYHDFLRPQNQFYVLSGVIAMDHSVSSFVSAMWSKAAGPTSEDDLQSTLELIPHLQSALRLHCRIADLDTRLQHACAALDCLPGSLIITDSSGRILHINRAAEVLLNAGKGICAGPEGLRTGSATQTARLREFIARAASTVTGNGQHPGGVIQIKRTGDFPLTLQVTPLASSSTGRLDRRPAVAIFIAEPDRLDLADPAILGALLELSPAEARLTAALAAGDTILQHAKKTGVSINTTRTLLARVFSKTGTARQADLVRLVLKTSGGWGLGKSGR
jgi:DNA-binding CsgD family transcriptional regulator